MRGLPTIVKARLKNAYDSALLAVEVYNKPSIAFKSAGYIMLMTVAWTAYFHAVFFRKRMKPFYKRDNGRYERVDGDYRHWELSECLRRYFGDDTQNPIRKNLEFFIPLRNKIEHRSLPELDSTIFGECQAMLLNLDAMLEKEFGAKWCLRQSLSFCLQMYPSSRNLAEAVKRNPVAKNAAEFIRSYRSSLSAEVESSSQYAFKAFLIAVGNHDSQEALAVQFFKYEALSTEQKAAIDPFVTMVKQKEPPVANANTMRPTDVRDRVKTALGDPRIHRGDNKEVSRVNLSWHTACCRHFSVHPPGGDHHPEATNTKYCIYDKRHDDYSYTEAWVKFLIEQFRDPAMFDTVPSPSSPPRTTNAT